MLNALLEVLLFLFLAVHPSVSGLPSLRAIGLELGDLEGGGWFPGGFFTGHGLCVLFASSAGVEEFSARPSGVNSLRQRKRQGHHRLESSRSHRRGCGFWLRA